MQQIVPRRIETLLIGLLNPRLAWLRYRKGISLRQLAILDALRREGRLDGVRNFIDAGAHEGEYAEACSLIAPHLGGVCFEPTPETFAKLRSRLNAHKSVRALPVALGSRSGTATLMRSAIDQANSLLPMTGAHTEAWEGSASSASVEVEVRSLDEVLAEQRIEGPFLLKVDVQGYEMELLRGAEATLKDTAVLQVEMSFVDLYDKGASFGEVWSHLQSRGFRFLRTGEFIVSPKDGVPLQGDLIFVKL